MVHVSIRHWISWTGLHTEMIDYTRERERKRACIALSDTPYYAYHRYQLLRNTLELSLENCTIMAAGHATHSVDTVQANRKHLKAAAQFQCEWRRWMPLHCTTMHTCLHSCIHTAHDKLYTINSLRCIMHGHSIQHIHDGSWWKKCGTLDKVPACIYKPWTCTEIDIWGPQN